MRHLLRGGVRRGVAAATMAAALIPSAFIDPIAHDVFVDPVTTSDGHSYSRAAITRWLADHDTSPVTGAVLPRFPGSTTRVDKRLAPNHALRKAIEEWRDQRPLPIDPARLSLLDELLGEGSFGRVVAGTLATGSSGAADDGSKTGVVAVAVKLIVGVADGSKSGVTDARRACAL